MECVIKLGAYVYSEPGDSEGEKSNSDQEQVVGRIVVTLKVTLELWITDYIYTIGYETKRSCGAVFLNEPDFV